jgi:hypothetical protein
MAERTINQRIQKTNDICSYSHFSREGRSIGNSGCLAHKDYSESKKTDDLKQSEYNTTIEIGQYSN